MLTVTNAAAQKLQELITDKSPDGTDYNLETVGLRVFVQGGGCSGFQYGMQLENASNETDNKFESNGIRIFVDPISIRYLQGATINFVETNTGQGFIINNPTAKSTCGCGSSFSA